MSGKQTLSSRNMIRKCFSHSSSISFIWAQQPDIPNSSNHHGHLTSACFVPGTASESCFISFMHYSSFICFSSFNHFKKALMIMSESQFCMWRNRGSKRLNNPGHLAAELVKNLHLCPSQGGVWVIGVWWWRGSTWMQRKRAGAMTSGLQDASEAES